MIEHTIQPVSESTRSNSSTRILLIWLFPQIVSLALSAAQIRFSYRWINPPQKWAVEQLLVTQMLLMSLVLFHHLRNCVICVLMFFCGASMLALAHAMALGDAQLAASVLSAAILLVAMHGWATISDGILSQALLNLWMWAGIVLMYCAIEFSGHVFSVWYSPALMVLAMSRGENSQRNLLFLLFASLAGVALVKKIISVNRSRSRQFLPR